MLTIAEFIRELPKAELHVHIEGTLEAEMKFDLASRNGIALPHGTPEDMRATYIFNDLPSFLAVYNEGLHLLIEEADFRDVCYSYLTKVSSQGVRYSEIFFDPQHHTRRGVAFGTVIEGLKRGCREAEEAFGIRSQLIMCVDRGFSAEFAMQTLLDALPYKRDIVGLGLDWDEKGNPPAKFKAVYERAREEGFRLTLHCDVDQENSVAHIGQALLDLKVDRIDHGLNVMDDAALIETAKRRGIVFTLCPFANESVRPGRGQAGLRDMLDAGLTITINSDDPGYMGSNYIAENMELAQTGAQLSRHELLTIARNAFATAWLPEDQRASFLDEIHRFSIDEGLVGAPSAQMVDGALA